MTHRGPFQPPPFCDSVTTTSWATTKDKMEIMPVLPPVNGYFLFLVTNAVTAIYTTIHRTKGEKL